MCARLNISGRDSFRLLAQIHHVALVHVCYDPTQSADWPEKPEQSSQTMNQQREAVFLCVSCETAAESSSSHLVTRSQEEKVSHSRERDTRRHVWSNVAVSTTRGTSGGGRMIFFIRGHYTIKLRLSSYTNITISY